MTTDAIAALPISQVMDRNAHLWLWATDNFDPDAHHCGRIWGFRYVCSWIWVKGRIHPATGKVVLQRGLGRYNRKCHERLMLFSRGAACVPAKAWPESVIVEPRTEHSRKPEVFYTVAEHVSLPRVPRLEVFARSGRPGWTSIGNEAPNSGGEDVAVTLSRMAGIQMRGQGLLFGSAR